ncbi:MAG: hypothetical protein IT289_01950 [Oligoflexia bacterium]|nr:hypothetical protein [Oligoflexia bacterium]
MNKTVIKTVAAVIGTMMAVSAAGIAQAREKKKQVQNSPQPKVTATATATAQPPKAH